MNGGTPPSFTRTHDDNCQLQYHDYASTSEMKYRLYLGQAENCRKCRVPEKFWLKISPEVVDAESELRNITRINSRCPQFKYNPTCVRSPSCTSTYDPHNPIIFAPEVCPIVFNNIPKLKTTGIKNPRKVCY